VGRPKGRLHGAGGRRDASARRGTARDQAGRVHGRVRRGAHGGPGEAPPHRGERATHLFFVCVQGVYDYSNGNRYEGQFKDSKRHGKGLLVWARGEKYHGDFVQVSAMWFFLFALHLTRCRTRARGTACLSGRVAIATRERS
jgi:hypothetical protein